MRRYNIVSRILLILTVSAFALAAPVLVQERRQSCVNEVHVPRAVLGKRALSDYLLYMLDGFEGMEGPAEGEPLPNLAEDHMVEEHAPPPGPPEEPMPEEHAPQPNLEEEPVLEVHPPPPNLPFWHAVQAHPPPPNLPFWHAVEDHPPPPNLPFWHAVQVHPPPPNLAGEDVPVPVLPDGPAEFDRESVVFSDDAPPMSPEHGHSPSPSPPTSPEWSTDSGPEDWHTAPSSPMVESSTESDSDSDH